MTQKQKVHFGHLANGQPGLFTGHYLALGLSPEEDSEEAARVVAERHGFEFETNEEREKRA